MPFIAHSSNTSNSEDTITRAQAAGVQLLPDDVSLVQKADIILSIVPPRDARATAERIITALSSSSPGSRAETKALYYADLNAISPSTLKSIGALFEQEVGNKVVLVDGAIIGGPPHLKSSTSSDRQEEEWYTPSIPTSGPTPLPSPLDAALKAKHISDQIGAASGLKMCFASLTKGYTAIAIQAFSTAHSLGVLPELQQAIETTIPGAKDRLEKGVTGMAPKAYRWVGEMEEIAATLREEGGWNGRAEGDVEGGGVGESLEDMFTGAAGVYRVVAEDTVLGKEKVGKRERGTTVEDVAKAVAEGLEDRKAKEGR